MSSLSSLSSFGTYEPSDAILAAMKARVGVKNLVRSDGGTEVAGMDDVQSGQRGAPSAPTFRLNGGLRETVPPEHQNIQASFPVAETGGIAFAVKEASCSYAPAKYEAEGGQEKGGMFQVGSSSPSRAKEPASGENSRSRLQQVDQGASSSEEKRSLGHSMRRQVPDTLSVIDENLHVDEDGDQGEQVQPSTSRSAGPPCVPATSSRKSSSHAMREAADEALAKALAQASAGLDMDIDFAELEAPPLEIPESQSLMKLPSAVTVAGEPVAAMGDMIYLGGGLYASCAPPEKPVKKKPRKPPRRPASVMRSASAHIVGSQTSQTGESGEFGSPQSRAQSEGHMGSEQLFSECRGSSRNGSALGGSSAGAPSAPRIWRPAGVQKLPPAKLVPPAGFGGRPSRLSQEDLGRMPGDHAEERAHNRRVSGKEGLLLFGPKGVLAHMRDGEHRQVSTALPGPPQGISKRLERRKLAKQARINEILEEREMRIATEAAMDMHRRHHVANMARHASAPELSEEELEKQRIRVACKMDILDFFHGYRKVVNKLTEEQQKVLHANLHGSGNSMEVDGAGRDMSQEPESIQDRLQRVNDDCNRVFHQA